MRQWVDIVSVIHAKQVPGGSGPRVQAVTLSGEVCRSLEAGRFPHAATAGSYFAASPQGADADSGILEQSRAGLAWLSDQVEQLGGSLTDVLKFNIFYVGHGTRDDWAQSARIRAAHFPEPGPCATGIPVERLAELTTAITYQVHGVAGSRADGRITGAWPQGHWDWPFHLPYRHGNRADGGAS